MTGTRAAPPTPRRGPGALNVLHPTTVAVAVATATGKSTLTT